MSIKQVQSTTSAGGVVLSAEGKVLVVKQRGNTWSLPKGHCEAGETVLETAIREIHEESGVENLVYICDLGSYQRLTAGLGEESHLTLKTIHLFLFRTEQANLSPIDEHNPEAVWVEPDKVADLLTHPKDKEFFLGINKGFLSLGLHDA